MEKNEIRKKMHKFMEEKPEPIIDAIDTKESEEKKNNQVNKKHPLYFEGQLQVRNSSSKIEEFIEKRVENAGEIISKKDRLKQNSCNYNISNRRLIHKIAYELRERFGGLIIESPKLFSYDKQRSKNIYRLNVLYTAPEYHIGDIILLKDSELPYKVTKFDKSDICLEGLKTSNKTKVREEQISRKLDSFQTRIISVRPEITALGKDYQPKKIIECKSKNVTTAKEPKEGMNLKVAEYQDLLYPIKPKIKFKD